MYSLCTVCVQYMYNFCRVYVQYMYSICTVYVQFMYGLCTVYVQFMYSFWYSYSTDHVKILYSLYTFLYSLCTLIETSNLNFGLIIFTFLIPNNSLNSFV